MVEDLRAVDELEQEDERILIESSNKVFVAISNNTSRTVDICRTDSGGKLVQYFRLHSGEFFGKVLDEVSLFVRPWVFSDVITGERHILNRKMLISPMSERAAGQSGAKWLIRASVPVCSLRSSAMNVIALHLPSSKAVNQLDIPSHLISDLKLFRAKTNYRRSRTIKMCDWCRVKLRRNISDPRKWLWRSKRCQCQILKLKYNNPKA